MPATPSMPPEKGPRLFVVLVRHQNPDATHFRPVPPSGVGRVRGTEYGVGASTAFVFLPDDAEEEGAGAVHDGDVRELPVAVVGDQGFHYELEEWVVGDGTHGVVGYSGGVGTADPGWVGE